MILFTFITPTAISSMRTHPTYIEIYPAASKCVVADHTVVIPTNVKHHPVCAISQQVC